MLLGQTAEYVGHVLSLLKGNSHEGLLLLAIPQAGVSEGTGRGPLSAPATLGGQGARTAPRLAHDVEVLCLALYVILILIFGMNSEL